MELAMPRLLLAGLLAACLADGAGAQVLELGLGIGAGVGISVPLPQALRSAAERARRRQPTGAAEPPAPSSGETPQAQAGVAGPAETTQGGNAAPRTEDVGALSPPRRLPRASP